MVATFHLAKPRMLALNDGLSMMGFTPRRLHAELYKMSSVPDSQTHLGEATACKRARIVELLQKHHADFALRYPIHRLALFGSWARGDAREDSDVDVLVDVDASIGLRFVDLADDMERALGRRVDLVSRRAIKPSLWKHIQPELIDV